MREKKKLDLSPIVKDSQLVSSRDGRDTERDAQMLVQATDPTKQEDSDMLTKDKNQSVISPLS